MGFLLAFATLFFMLFAGQTLVGMLAVPLPGPLAGLLLLFFALLFRGKLPSAMRTLCQFLLSHLMLFFIPLVAGIVMHFERLEKEWLAFIVAGLGATALAIAVSGLTFPWMLRRVKARQ